MELSRLKLNLYDIDDENDLDLNDNEYNQLKQIDQPSVLSMPNSIHRIDNVNMIPKQIQYNIYHQEQQSRIDPIIRTDFIRFNHTDHVWNLNGTACDPAARTHFVTIFFSHQNEKSAKFFVNRLVEWYEGSDIIHCELYLESDQLTCSIDQNHPVHLIQNKAYAFERFKRKWSGVRLELAWDDYDRMYQYCMRQRGLKFDKTSLYTFCCSHTFTTPDRNTWICSRLVSSALQMANVLPGAVDIYEVSPASLREMLVLLEINGTSARSKEFIVNYPKYTTVNKFTY